MSMLNLVASLVKVGFELPILFPSPVEHCDTVFYFCSCNYSVGPPISNYHV